MAFSGWYQRQLPPLRGKVDRRAPLRAARRKGGQRLRMNILVPRIPPTPSARMMRCPPFRLPSLESDGIHLPPQGGKSRRRDGRAAIISSGQMQMAEKGNAANYTNRLKF